MSYVDLANIVTISVSNPPLGLSEYRVNNLAIFTKEEPTNEDITATNPGVYLSPSGVAEDWGTDSEVYAQARLIFSQSPNILDGDGSLIICPMGEATLEEAIVALHPIIYFGGALWAGYDPEDEEITDASNSCEPIRVKLFASSCLEDSIDGLFAAIVDASKVHTRCLVYLRDEDPLLAREFAAAYAGRAMSVDFNDVATTSTMHLKSLVGVNSDTAITQTILANCKSVGVDCYPAIGGGAQYIGKVFSTGANGFFDNIYNLDWFVFALAVAGFNALATTGTKIAQTEKGVATLKSAYIKVVDQAIANGFVAPGAWSSPELFGNPEDLKRNLLNIGYYVWSLPIDQQLAAARAGRAAPLIRIAIKFAGAIHSSHVIINTNCGVVDGSFNPPPPVIPPPVLSLEVNNPDQTLDLTWTLPDTYDSLFLERGLDGVSFTPLVTLEGDDAAYDDGDVEPEIEYFYRIRGIKNGAYSAWSNVVSGELEVVPPPFCEYVPPSDMGSDAPFSQGFADGDFVDPEWVPNLQTQMAPGSPVGGLGGMAGNLFISENGRKVICSGALGAGMVTVVVTREDNDSFTVQTLHAGGGLVLWGYVMSRTGLIAGRVDGGLNGHSAVWLSGPTSPPTIDSSVSWWSRISPDGTKLYGANISNQVIERTIGGGDVVVASGARRCSGLNYCCNVVVVDATGDDPLKVYKKIEGVWTHVATLADAMGDTEAPGNCCNITGDGTKAFGSSTDGNTPYMWDISGTGTINAVAMALPVDYTSGDCYVSFVASGGEIVLGVYTSPDDEVSGGIFWLASEDYAIAHNLSDYLTSEGVPGLGPVNGDYLGRDNTVCSADGTQFAMRAYKWPANADMSLFFAAAPSPA